jgi:hypothetical protein
MDDSRNVVNKKIAKAHAAPTDAGSTLQKGCGRLPPQAEEQAAGIRAARIEPEWHHNFNL